MTTHTEAELRGDLERLNRTVAELVGWEPQPNPQVWRAPKGGMRPASWIPKYTASLDACRTFEEGLTALEMVNFNDQLHKLLNKNFTIGFVWQLSPADHCVAFLKLKGVCE